MITVQDLMNWCDDHGRSYDTDINVYANSSLGYMPAVIKDKDNSSEIYLDYC